MPPDDRRTTHLLERQDNEFVDSESTVRIRADSETSDCSTQAQVGEGFIACRIRNYEEIAVQSLICRKPEILRKVVSELVADSLLDGNTVVATVDSLLRLVSMALSLQQLAAAKTMLLQAEHVSRHHGDAHCLKSRIGELRSTLFWAMGRRKLAAKAMRVAVDSERIAARPNEDRLCVLLERLTLMYAELRMSKESLDTCNELLRLYSNRHNCVHDDRETMIS
jgi:hypothetical protein